MRRHREYPYPNSKIVMAIFWTAMAFGGFWIFLFSAAFILLILFSLAFNDSPSGTGPVTEAERRFCYALTLNGALALPEYARIVELAADDERVPRPKPAGAEEPDSRYGEGWLITAALNNRGVRRAALGDADEALADFSEALRIDPNMKMAYENRALAHMRKGDYAAAVDDFDSAMLYSRHHGYSVNRRAHLGKAVAHALAGNEAAADAEFRLAQNAGSYYADDPDRAKERVLSASGSITYGGPKGNLCPDS